MLILEDCWILEITPHAILIGYEGEEWWIPRAEIVKPDSLAVDDEGITVRVKERKAIHRKKGAA